MRATMAAATGGGGALPPASIRKSASIVPDSILSRIEVALPARSVAVAEGVQVIEPAPAAVPAVTLGVPSVTVTADRS